MIEPPPPEIPTIPTTPKMNGYVFTVNESPSPIEDRDTVVTNQPVDPSAERLIANIVVLKDGRAEPREDDDSNGTRVSQYVT